MKIVKYKKNQYKLDMAPLIDVVFLLLIFFMLTFAIQGQAMDIKLPQGHSTSNPIQQKDVTIRISASGGLLLDNSPVTLEKLVDELKVKLVSSTNKLVKIEPDKKSKYKQFAIVLDYARIAGAEDFSIVR